MHTLRAPPTYVLETMYEPAEVVVVVVVPAPLLAVLGAASVTGGVAPVVGKVPPAGAAGGGGNLSWSHAICSGVKGDSAGGVDMLLATVSCQLHSQTTKQLSNNKTPLSCLPRSVCCWTRTTRLRMPVRMCTMMPIILHHYVLWLTTREPHVVPV